MDVGDFSVFTYLGSVLLIGCTGHKSTETSGEHENTVFCPAMSRAVIEVKKVHITVIVHPLIAVSIPNAVTQTGQWIKLYDSVYFTLTQVTEVF